MKKLIKIQTTEGARKIKALKRKWLAVNRNKMGLWTLTYTPSGFAFPLVFFNRQSAIAGAKLARQIISYPLGKNRRQECSDLLDTLEENEINFYLEYNEV
jgi:hypothetical protein